MSRVTIDIYSDVVCPWCYVGKRRLERALDRLVVQAEVIWRPFELNPTMPMEGMDRTAYLEAKFGSLNVFHSMEEHVLEAGSAEGIAFAFERIRRTPNTLAAHRLIWYGRQQGLQAAVVESLFRGYFEEGADLGSHPELVRLAARAGLDAEAYLFGEAGIARSRPRRPRGIGSAFGPFPISS
jgi:predicted DsbA family dithiol-disulfide isomerase